MTGIKVTKLASAVISQHQFINLTKPFDTSYIKLVSKVKHFNMMDMARGMIMQTKGEQLLKTMHKGGSSKLESGIEYFLNAIENFENALDSNSYHKPSLLNCARVLWRLSLCGIQKHNLQKDHIRMDSFLSVGDPKIRRANEYYRRALSIAPEDTDILYQYAQFLKLCNKPLDAENFYLKSLEADPNHIFALRDYGAHLSQVRLEMEAEKFYARVRAIDPSGASASENV